MLESVDESLQAEKTPLKFILNTKWKLEKDSLFIFFCRQNVSKLLD